MATSRWVYRRADGFFVRGGFSEPVYDQATEGVVEFPDADPHPDPVLERYDASLGKRPATAQESAAARVALNDAAATSRLDGDKVLRTLVVWLAQRFGITPADARQELLAIYRSLP